MSRTKVLSVLSLMLQSIGALGVLRENGRDVYVDVSQRASEMARRKELTAARQLLHSQLPLAPRDAVLWAQLGNLERRLAKKEGVLKLHKKCQSTHQLKLLLHAGMHLFAPCWAV